MDTLSAHFFTWSGNHGTCEVSDLPVDGLPERFSVAGRTRTVDFVRGRQQHDSEGDLEFTEYRSAPDGAFTIKVFND